jgi:hypothetical protein
MDESVFSFVDDRNIFALLGVTSYALYPYGDFPQIFILNCSFIEPSSLSII